MKTFSKFISFLFCMVIFTSCGNQKNEEYINIGSITPLTGEVSIYGTNTVNGAKLAVDEINKNGGVLGKKLKLIIEDDRGDLHLSKKAYENLKKEKIDCLIGPVTSNCALEISKYANNDKTLMITPSASAKEITDDKNFVFRTCFTDSYQGKILARYVKNILKEEKIALLVNENSYYSKSVSKEFVKEAKKLNLNNYIIHYADDKSDFSDITERLKRYKYKNVLISDYYRKISLIAPQLKQSDKNFRLIGSDGWIGILDQMDAPQNESIEKAVFTAHYSANSKDKHIEEFVKAYQKEHDRLPSSFAALGYDSIYLYKEALEKAQSTDSQKVSKQLEKIQFKGVTGSLHFDKNHDPIKAISILRIENKNYAFDNIIEPDNK